MKTIKIIDLIIKMANGEKMPNKIKWNTEEWEYIEEMKDYYSFDRKVHLFNTVFPNDGLGEFLNDEVEILDEEEKRDNFTGIKFFQGGECVMSILNEPQIPVEDEFEDIEEIEIQEIEVSSHLEFKRIINSLIKNQKKIIERLNDVKDKR